MNGLRFEARSAAPRAAESKDRLRLWLRLLKTARHIEGEVRERFRSEFGFTLPRFDVLAALYRAGHDLRMSEISTALRVSNGNVTGIVDRLVADGQLERVAVPGDRRATRVRLTRQGREMFERVAAVHEGWIDGLLAGIDGEEARRMTAMLAPIAERWDRNE